MSRRPTWGHRLEHAAFRGIGGIARVLPEGAALALGAGAGAFIGGVLRVWRERVDPNLRRAFPARSTRWRREVAARCYRHFGREMAALLRLYSAGPERIRERTEFGDGFRELRTAVEEGRGAIVVSGHLGNWELGGAALSVRGIPMDVLARRQSNPLFDRAIREIREGVGMRLIEPSEGPRPILRALRDGRAVAFVGDQDARDRGVFVDFFGIPASTPRGPALFSLRTGAPLFIGLMLREPGPRARYRGVIERVDADLTGDAEEDVRRLTRAHTGILQGYIEAYPEQYLWLHRRWKTEPSDRDA